MTYNEESREQTQATIFLETWGSTSYPPTRLEYRARDGSKHVYRWAESGYAPEWLSKSDDLDGCDRDSCVTVLHYGFGDIVPPVGMRELYQYQCGEKECPDCEGKGKLPDEEWIPEDLRGTYCTLCNDEYQIRLLNEGSAFYPAEHYQAAGCGGILYWGEEWRVVVFGPAISYGSGQPGYLYDDGPHFTNSIDNAIDALVESFDDYFAELEEQQALAYEGVLTLEKELNGDTSPLTGAEQLDINEQALAVAEAELALMRECLKRDGIFYPTNRKLAGGRYAEITDLGE